MVSTNSADVILSGPGSVLEAMTPMHTNAGRLTLAAGRDFRSAARRGLTIAGTLSLSGASDLQARSFAQDPGATLQIEIAGEGDETFSHLVIDGAASLHGLLGVSLSGGYLPEAGTGFEVLTAGLVSGRFSSLTTTGIAAGAGHFEPVYSERPDPSLRGRPRRRRSPRAGGIVAVPMAAWLLARRRRAQRSQDASGLAQRASQ